MEALPGMEPIAGRRTGATISRGMRMLGDRWRPGTGRRRLAVVAEGTEMEWGTVLERRRCPRAGAREHRLLTLCLRKQWGAGNGRHDVRGADAQFAAKRTVALARVGAGLPKPTPKWSGANAWRYRRRGVRRSDRGDGWEESTAEQAGRGEFDDAAALKAGTPAILRCFEETGFA